MNEPAGLTQDDWIRRELAALTDARTGSWTVVGLCARYHELRPDDPKPLKHQTIYKFLRYPKPNSSRHLSDRTREKLELVIGRSLLPPVEAALSQPAYGSTLGPVEPIRSYGILALPDTEIPVVFVGEYPTGLGEGQMRQRLSEIRRGSYKRAPHDPPDPDLVWIRLKEPLSEHMLAGDDVLMSPALRDSIQDGEFCIIECGPEVIPGELRAAGGKAAVRTRAGRRFEHGTFRILGKVVRYTAPPR